LYLSQQKIIYNNLNKCIIRDSFIDAEIWIRKNKLSILKNYLNKSSTKNDMVLSASIIDLQPCHMIPPTFLQTNDLIKPFQEIINTFSIPNYREINPACFSVVTFPFLFGIMFGDMGHGSLLILLGIYILIFQNRIKTKIDSFLKPLIEYRFIIIFFGVFAFYCGLIYNEFFSLPIPIFHSCYQKRPIINNTNFNFTTNDNFKYDKMEKKENCVYPIGVDPTWNISKNELNFLNSLKMKISIIIGVLHMMLGIILSGINFINSRQYSNILTVFLPKIIFMGALFGYLCVMIIFKWTTDWNKIQLVPPSLINQFLNIFLKGGVIVKFHFVFI